jgi:prevent-host-death family protein
MKTATISEAKNQLSRLISRVKRGETVLILDRDRPVARLVPAGLAEGGDEGRLAELESRGVLRRARLAPLKKLPEPIELPGGASVLEGLLELREQAPY